MALTTTPEQLTVVDIEPDPVRHTWMLALSAKPGGPITMAKTAMKTAEALARACARPACALSPRRNRS
jgi:hypothetical protein